MDYLKDVDRDELEVELKKAWDEKDVLQKQLHEERSSWPARWFWSKWVPKKHRWICLHAYFAFERRGADEWFIRTPLLGISWAGITWHVAPHNEMRGELEIGLLPNLPMTGGGYLYRYRFTKFIKRAKPLAVFYPRRSSTEGFTCSVRG